MEGGEFMMIKRTILVALCILLLGATPAHAAETKAIPVTPTLTFNGTTALCDVTVSSYGRNISVTLELWDGNTLVDTWTKSGVSIVTVSEHCLVTRGNTYTLKVTGSVNNESITGAISKKCT